MSFKEEVELEASVHFYRAMSHRACQVSPSSDTAALHVRVAGKIIYYAFTCFIDTMERKLCEHVEPRSRTQSYLNAYQYCFPSLPKSSSNVKKLDFSLIWRIHTLLTDEDKVAPEGLETMFQPFLNRANSYVLNPIVSLPIHFRAAWILYALFKMRPFPAHNSRFACFLANYVLRCFGFPFTVSPSSQSIVVNDFYFG